MLIKQEFRDSLRLRYNVPLSDLPSKCVCGEKYTVCHALSCKKGGFVAQRHDGVRNLLTSFLGKICTNVDVEPQLQPQKRRDKSRGKAGHEGRGLLVSRSYSIFRCQSNAR